MPSKICRNIFVFIFCGVSSISSSYSQAILKKTESFSDNWSLRHSVAKILSFSDSLKMPLFPQDRVRVLTDYKKELADYRHDFTAFIQDSANAQYIGEALVYNYFVVDNDSTQNFLYKKMIEASSLKETDLLQYFKEELDGRFLHREGCVISDLQYKNALDDEVFLHFDRMTLLVFWASWCAPCRAENPILIELYKKYNSSQFCIQSFSLDDNANNWQRVVKMDKLPWENIWDPNSWDGRVARYFAIHQIPQNVLIDKDGRILARNIPLEKLDKLLKK